ncbi:MAG: LiaF domain-containing protein [Chloroflexota bacterium]
MRRGNVFWGVILILLGVLFFLKTINLIDDVLGWFWPLALMLLGLAVLFGRYLPHSVANTKSFSIDLEGATKLDLEVEHGVGSLFFSGGAPAGVAVSGVEGLALEVKSHRTADSLGVEIHAGPSVLPFLGPESGEWHFNLTTEVPVAIKLDAGASNLVFDLTEIKLTYLGLDTGASSVKAQLPAHAGHTLVNIESGAASIDLIVPEGVGARIRLEQGASSVSIDEKRFPKLTDFSSIYQSPDYDSAANKVEIILEGGANSVKVH